MLELANNKYINLTDMSNDEHDAVNNISNAVCDNISDCYGDDESYFGIWKNKLIDTELKPYYPNKKIDLIIISGFLL